MTLAFSTIRMLRTYLYLLCEAKPRLALQLLIVGIYFGHSVYIGGDVWNYTGTGADRSVIITIPMVFGLLTVLFNYGQNYSEQRGNNHMFPASSNGFFII